MWRSLLQHPVVHGARRRSRSCSSRSILALLVHQGLPGQWLWRLSFFMPFLLASTVVAQIWIWMYNPQLGLVNDMLGAVGVEPVAWLQDPTWAMFAVVVMTTVVDRGLQLPALPGRAAEHPGAAVRGVRARRRRAGGGSCCSITLPQLGPTTVLIVILQILASLKVFDQIYQS